MNLGITPSSASSTNYGRACTSCARAKAKCVPCDPPTAKCERCQRLNKDCQPPQATRKRKVIGQKPPTKVDRLEQKLDGLVTLLQSATHSEPAVNGAAVASTHPVEDQLTPESLQSIVPTPRGNGHDEPKKPQPICVDKERPDIRYCPGSGLSLHVPVIHPSTSYTATGTRSAAYHSPNPSAALEFEPSVAEAEAYLQAYKETKNPYFPVIILPPHYTAQHLRQERPFVWLCIMAVSCRSTEQQHALGREIRLTIGREMILEGKNNMDLLLGILLYTAWGHYHVYAKPIMTGLMQLAMGLVANLGLNKMPLKESPQMMLSYDARGCPKPFTISPRMMEERRAVIGCFIISSVVSSYYQRIDALRWSSYTNECLHILEEQKEHPSDVFLVQLVHSQLIVEKAAQAPWNDPQADIDSSFKVPSQLYLKALQRRLQDFKQRIPPDMQQNDILLLHIYKTDLVVHEVALVKGDHDTNNPDFQRLECLYACLYAVKNWFDLFLKLPPASYIGISMAEFTQLAHCMIALYRLSTFEWPDWDRGLVRDFANLSTILDQLSTNFAGVKAAAELDKGCLDNKDVFTVTSRAISHIKTWWDSKASTDFVNPDTATIDTTTNEAPIDFLDDAWLQDILGTGPYRFEAFE